jgi:peptidyl-prolyl cis-trans isomerase C
MEPMTRIRLGPLVPLLLLTLLTPSCKKKRQSRCPTYVQVRTVAPQPGDVVVAEVNGRPILAEAVRQRALHDKRTVREALRALIDEELLVQEAERRGLHRDPEVVEAGKAAAIYQLLAKTFEKEFTPAQVDESELRRLYKHKSRGWYNRPELRRFTHAYLTRPWIKRGGRWSLDIEKDRHLKHVLQNFRRLLIQKRPKTWEAFNALATNFDQGDQALAVGIALSARKDLRRTFSDALFALSRPGDFSEVIETRPWYHVAFLIQVMPRKSIPFSEAREMIRSKVFPRVRKEAFRAWVKKVKQQCSIRVKPENLPVGDHSTTASAGGR